MTRAEWKMKRDELRQAIDANHEAAEPLTVKELAAAEAGSLARSRSVSAARRSCPPSESGAA